MENFDELRDKTFYHASSASEYIRNANINDYHLISLTVMQLQNALEAAEKLLEISFKNRT